MTSPFWRRPFQTSSAQVRIPLTHEEDVGVQTHQPDQLVSLDHSRIVSTVHAESDRRVEGVLAKKFREECSFQGRVSERPISLLAGPFHILLEAIVPVVVHRVPHPVDDVFLYLSALAVEKRYEVLFAEGIIVIYESF